MTITNAYCKKCKKMEPDNWNFYTQGMWVCECRKFKPEPRWLDKAIAKLNKKGESNE